jgi:internalin A
MPTPSETRVNVSGEPSKVVELLCKRLRLSLGAMMIIVLGIGGVLGWVAHRAHVQRDAVAAITTPRRNTRGSVYYDWQFVDGKFDPDAKPPAPKWLRDALGPDVFDTVVIVTIEGDNVDDKFLENIGKLHWVENVDLVGHFAPDLTPAAMAQLWILPRLKILNTRRGIAIPRGFVTGLAGRTGLRGLWLPQAAVTDDEMAIIGSFTNLEFLQLDGSNVTDRGFAHVANLKKLTILDMSLTGTKLTDSSIETLAGFQSLKSLNLDRSRMSPAGIERLKRALPKARISSARMFE